MAQSLPDDLTGVPLRAVTFRSVLLGFIGVVLICAIAPYNAYIANNTDIIGNALPSGVLMFFFAFVLLINAPLHYFAPKRAFSSGELAVALAMTLVSCTLPAAGLMRYLPGHLVSFYAHAAVNGDYEQIMRQLEVPDWVWPSFESTDPVTRGNEPVVRDFLARVPTATDTFWDHFTAIPFSLWVRPAITWAIFFAALFGAIICLMAIFREQWAANERLPFPLATVFVSLIEEPAPGRAVNSLFASPIFWIGFSVVFCLHGINALNEYLPTYIPPMPLQFDLQSMLTDFPFNSVDWQLKAQTISFTVIGLAYFIRGSVGFSLWFSFILVEIAHMWYGAMGSDLNAGMQLEQMFGALIALGIGVLWIGRVHLIMVFRHMFGQRDDRENRGRFVPYSLAGWGWFICIAIMIIWLAAAGASVVGAIVIVLLIMLTYLVLAKIVAETGLPYAQTWMLLWRPWNILDSLTGLRTSLGSYFWSSFFSSTLMTDVRQSLPSYSLHAFRTADIVHNGRTPYRRALAITGCIVAALVIGYAVSGVSTLYIHYTYTTSLSADGTLPDQNGHGWYNMPRWEVLAPTLNYLPDRKIPEESHSQLGHISAGFIITSVLSFLRLNFNGWPLHPACFMLAHTWGIRMTWFSIFVGWLAKSLIVRFGGARFFESARPLFLALILGEAIATAFWLIVSLILAMSGHEFKPMTFIPA